MSCTNRLVGVPSSTVLNSTNNFAFGSLVAKYTSTDVKNAPVSSVVNDCASGSLLGASMNCVSVSFLVLIIVVISFGLCGGGGGFLTPTVLVVCVIITPLPVNVPVASLARAVEPGKGIVPSDAAVILNVLVPVRKTFGGFGFAFFAVLLFLPIILYTKFGDFGAKLRYCTLFYFFPMFLLFLEVFFIVFF